MPSPPSPWSWGEGGAGAHWRGRGPAASAGLRAGRRRALPAGALAARAQAASLPARIRLLPHLLTARPSPAASAAAALPHTPQPPSIINRERASKSYRVLPYYVARFICDMPLRVGRQPGRRAGGWGTAQVCGHACGPDGGCGPAGARPCGQRGSPSQPSPPARPSPARRSARACCSGRSSTGLWGSTPALAPSSSSAASSSARVRAAGAGGRGARSNARCLCCRPCHGFCCLCSHCRICLCRHCGVSIARSKCLNACTACVLALPRRPGGPGPWRGHLGR